MTPAVGDRPRIVVRADASARIGLGHLRRCTALGRRLQAAGAAVHFLTRTEGIDSAQETGGFADAYVALDPALPVRDDAALTAAYCHSVGATRLIVDHYHADEHYQRVLLDSGVPWLQFDGAASMPLWADWIVSMSPAADEARYRALQCRPQTRLLLGPHYAILREECLQRRGSLRPVSPQAERLLITFGGGDDRGACLASLEAIRHAGRFETTILTSGYNPHISSIRVQLERTVGFRGRLLIDDTDVARRMTEADIAITAGGTTTFEMAMLGLPMLIIQIADNQRANAQAWQRTGVAVDLGPLEELNMDRLRDQLVGLAGDPARREQMSMLGRQCVDGLGAERIARELCPEIGVLS